MEMLTHRWLSSKPTQQASLSICCCHRLTGKSYCLAMVPLTSFQRFNTASDNLESPAAGQSQAAPAPWPLSFARLSCASLTLKS